MYAFTRKVQKSSFKILNMYLTNKINQMCEKSVKQTIKLCCAFRLIKQYIFSSSLFSSSMWLKIGVYYIFNDCLWQVRAQFFFHSIRCILIIVCKYLKVRISCSTLLLLSFVNCDMRSPSAVVFLRIFRIRPKDSVFECIIAHWAK